MPRKLLIVALTVVALHVCEVLTLGTSTTGTFLANSLQIFACGLALAMAFATYRRGDHPNRPFWVVAGIGIHTCGVANPGGTYCDISRHSAPPTGSAWRLLIGSL